MDQVAPNRLGQVLARLGSRERIVALTFALAVLSALLPTLSAWVAIERQRRAELNDRLDRSVEVVQGWFTKELDRNLSTATEIAARRNVEAAVRFSSQPELRRTLVGLKERTRLGFIAFFDKDATVIERDPSNMEDPESVSVVAVALGGQATATIQSTPQGITLMAAAPVYSENGLVGAVLVGDFLDERFAGQLRRLTGLEIGFVGSDRAVGSLREWTTTTLLGAVDARTRLRLLGETRNRLIEDRTLAGKPYHVALTQLPGLGGQPPVIILLGLPATGVAGSEVDAAALFWPWLVLVPLWGLAAWWLRRRVDRAPPVVAPQPEPAPQPVAVLGDPATAAVPAPGNGAAGAPVVRVDGVPAAIVRSPEECVAIGPLVIDRAAHEVRMNGKLVALTPTEFALLWQLGKNVGRAQSRDDLINAVWGEDQFAEPAMVDAHIGNLRRKIEPVPGRPTFIVTVRGVGYKMVVPELSDVTA